MKKIILLHYIFLMLFISCQNKNNNEKNSFSGQKLNSLIEKINKQNLPQRLKSFDSLMRDSLKLKEYEVAQLQFEKANVFLEQYNEIKAKKLFEKIIPVFKKYNKQELLGKTFVNYAITLLGINKKKEATDYLYKAIEIAKKINSTRIESRAYGELAHVFYLFNDLDKSTKYLKKVLQIQKKENDLIGQGGTYNNLALLLVEKNNYREAYKYLLKAIGIYKKIGDEIGLSDTYNSIGAVGNKINISFDTIYNYYSQAIRLRKKNNINNFDVYINLGLVFFNKKDYDNSDKYFKLSLKESKNKNDSISVLKNLINLALIKNNSDKMYNLFIKKDSLMLALEKENNKENIKLLEKNHKLSINKINLELEKRKLEKKNYFYWFIILFILFLASIIGMVFYNKSIKLQKQRFELERKVLRSQLNPHFVYNSLTALQNSLLEKNPIDAISYISKFAKLFRKIFSYVSEKSISLSEEIRILNKYMEMQKLRFNELEFKINIEKNINPNNIYIPPLLLQPLVENSIEHGFVNAETKGKIELNIYKNKNKICFEVKDNGLGISNKNEIIKSNHALDILQKRLSLFNKRKTKFQIKNLKTGVIISFCVEAKQ